MPASAGSAPRKGRGTRKPVDDKTKARIIEATRKYVAEGRSQTSIAREFGISGSTLNKWCQAATPPITWDRSWMVKEAVEAHATDMRARRVALAEGLLADVEKLRGMMFQEVTRVHFSVTNGRQEYKAPSTPNEIKDLFIAAGIAMDKHQQLARFDTDDRDLPAVDAWLDHIMGGEAKA